MTAEECPVENALSALVFGPEPSPDAPAAVQAWLARCGVEGAAARHLVAELPRLLVYRRLARHTLRETVELAIPRTLARLGDRFDQTFDAFLEQRGPRSPWLRDVTSELLAWCLPRWETDPEVAAYIPELARYEAVRLTLAAMEDDPVAPPRALELERPVRFTVACRLQSFRHAVHRLPEALDDRSLPEAEPTHLLAYRDREHEIRTLCLTPWAACLVRELLNGVPLAAALRRTADVEGTPLTDAELQGAAALLADLASRGVVLGPA